VNISVTVDDRETRRVLDRAMKAVADPKDLMRTLADQQYRSTVDNFKSESFDGGPWPALKPATAQAFITGKQTRGFVKTAGGRGAAITLLTPKTEKQRKRTGKRRGYDNMLRPNGKLIFQRIHQRHTSTEARVECSNPWAFVHNYGARMSRMTMPRRTFLGFSRKDLADIRAACEWWVKRSVLP